MLIQEIIEQICTSEDLERKNDEELHQIISAIEQGLKEFQEVKEEKLKIVDLPQTRANKQKIERLETEIQYLTDHMPKLNEVLLYSIKILKTREDFVINERRKETKKHINKLIEELYQDDFYDDKEYDWMQAVGRNGVERLNTLDELQEFRDAADLIRNNLIGEKMNQESFIVKMLRIYINRC